MRSSLLVDGRKKKSPVSRRLSSDIALRELMFLNFS